MPIVLAKCMLTFSHKPKLICLTCNVTFSLFFFCRSSWFKACIDSLIMASRPVLSLLTFFRFSWLLWCRICFRFCPKRDAECTCTWGGREALQHVNLSASEHRCAAVVRCAVFRCSVSHLNLLEQFIHPFFCLSADTLRAGACRTLDI
eukprot:SAG31_NODE_595_length_13695_cov_11.446896_3_plen_148_part_00